MNRFLTLIAVVATALCLVVAAPAPAQDDSPSDTKPIVIGVAGPFTGPSAQFGVQIRYGVTLAQEEINEAGGINGRPVELVFEDDAAQQSEANKVALKLASNPDVIAVVGHFNSSCSLAARGIYADAGIVMFSPASTNTTVTQGYDNVFRNIFNDRFQGESVARLLKEVMGMDRVAIIYDNDDYGRGLYDYFNAKAEELGLRVVAATAYDRDTTDFRPLLQPMIKRRPEALVLGGLYQEAALITMQARELGMSVPLIGTDGVFSDKYVELAGKSADGTRVTTPFVFDDENERAVAFASRTKARFGSEPDAWAALSYDALKIVASAIEHSGADRAAVRDHLAAMDTVAEAYDGLSGVTYFDANGDCVKPVMISEIRDGKFRMAKEQLPTE
jgi:branched-chain amino acid transport system substrate-binding protein